MRRLLFVAVVAVVALGPLVACGSEQAESAKHEENLPDISIADVAAGLEANQLTVVDCNSEKTRKKVGVLPGAVLVEDEETYPASVLPADKSRRLVFYCGGPG